MERIILASASPRRRELLEKAGVCFEVLPGTGEENITGTEPEEIVKELSFTKALSAAEKYTSDMKEGTIIIGADTIVTCDGSILGKPSDEEDAVRTLLRLQGRSHQVYTGVTLLQKEKGKWQNNTFAECTEVEFYPVSEEEIRAYAKSGDPLDKAGSYGIQGPFCIYVKGIHGDYNNVVGLPVARLFYEAKKLGMNLKGNVYDKGMYI